MSKSPVGSKTSGPRSPPRASAVKRVYIGSRGLGLGFRVWGCGADVIGGFSESGYFWGP